MMVYWFANIRGLTILAVCFSLFWLLLSEAEFSSLLLGIIFIFLALWLSANLDSANAGKIFQKIAWRRVPEFIFYLVWQSIKGGLLTFQLAIRPNLLTSTGLFTYKTRLTDRFAQVLLAEVVSLVPGTICADLSDGLLTIHALDLKADPIPGIVQCEKRIAALLGLNLGKSL